MELEQLSINLTPKQLTYTLVALRKYAKTLAEKDEEDMGDDYEDLLMIESIIDELEQVRKENMKAT